MPWCGGNGEGLEKAGGGGGCSVLIGLASRAISDVLAYLVGQARPIEVTGETGNGFGGPKVAGDGDVVGFVKECGAEVGCDIEAVVGGVEEVVDDDEVVPAIISYLLE